jgi:hypothetical protein
VNAACCGTLALVPVFIKAKKILFANLICDMAPIISSFDAKALLIGGIGWVGVIPLVRGIGRYTAARTNNQDTRKAIGMGAGVIIAAVTTPLISSVLGWETTEEKTRGIALGLGVAQLTDGVVHLLFPSFYDKDDQTAIQCAGHIFWGAGLVGILSCYQ